MPTTVVNIKRPNDSEEALNGNSPPSKIRRIHPLKIGEVRGSTSFRNDSDDDDNKNKTKLDLSSQTSSSEAAATESQQLLSQDENPTTTTTISTEQQEEVEKKKQNEETDELKRFIKACRKAESNDDMKKIIKKKLLKNYHLVSATFVVSSNFRKLLKDTADDILRDPKRVYSKIQDIVNELEARKLRKQKNEVEPVVEVATATTSQESTEENGLHLESTGDKKKDSHLKKLNRALVSLKHQIEDLEEAEVNLDDDDDSAYMQKVRFEKRAIEIYNKICELTGESTHAHRIVKKPIRFKDSKYKEFNKGLTKKINKENGFPSYFDVYRLLDFCNKEHKYQLAKYQVEEVARASFTSVGELLKERRRDDLYESASYWTRETKDPAKEDAELKAKLDVNREINRKKTDEIIEFYVKKQYEENSTDQQQQPGTSKSFAIKEEEENEIICPAITPPANDEEIISLIDVKAEQISEEYDKSSNDDTLLKFAILS